MKGNSILINGPQARGVSKSATIDDTSYPGTMMQVTPAAALVNGRPHVEHYQPAADGDPRVKIVLVDDYTQGGLWSLPATVGANVKIYYPLPGEEINVVVAAQVGTGNANAYTIGERLIPQHTTGQMIAEATSSFAAWFMAMEAITITADAVGWVWVETQN